MKISAKKAFAAVAFTVVSSLIPASYAMATEEDGASKMALTIDAAEPANKAESKTIKDFLTGASDATPTSITDSNWFINDITLNIPNVYVEETTPEELKEYALDGLKKLSADTTSYTIADAIEAALDSILHTLDPHSDYMTAKEFKAMNTRTSGRFAGLGIQVSLESQKEEDKETSRIKIVNPMEDTPASKAGIQPGDIITHINDKPTEGMSLADAVDLMRGKPGEEIEITIRREGEIDPLELTLIREIIKTSPVTSHLIGSDIGYINISSFNALTTEKLEKAVKDLEDSTSDIKAYILDLRFNPGGLLSQAIDVSDSFLHSGAIVSTGNAKGVKQKPARAKFGDIINGKPLIVLINGGSASASEIVAAALQDNNRATIMGTQSFGKGSVQTIFPFEQYYADQKGAMKITTYLYYRGASDLTVQKKGVTPDIRTEFEGTASDPANFIRSEADLEGIIANPNLVEDSGTTSSTCKASKNIPDVDTLDKMLLLLNLKDERKEADYQKICAIEYLRGDSEYTAIEKLPVVIPQP